MLALKLSFFLLFVSQSRLHFFHVLRRAFSFFFFRGRLVPSFFAFELGGTSRELVPHARCYMVMALMVYSAVDLFPPSTPELYSIPRSPRVIPASFEPRTKRIKKSSFAKRNPLLFISSSLISTPTPHPPIRW